MNPQLGQKLAGKDVMNSSGAKLGTLFNVTLDMRTGELNKLLVTPVNEGPTAERPSYSKDAHGRYQIPVSNVQSISDYLIVS